MCARRTCSVVIAVLPEKFLFICFRPLDVAVLAFNFCCSVQFVSMKDAATPLVKNLPDPCEFVI